MIFSCASEGADSDIGASFGNIDVNKVDEKLLSIDFSKADADASSYVIYEVGDIKDSFAEGRNAIQSDFISKVMAEEDSWYRAVYFEGGKLVEYTDTISHDKGFTYNTYKVSSVKTEKAESFEYTCLREVNVYDLSGMKDTYRKIYIASKDKDTTYADYLEFLGRAYSGSDDPSGAYDCITVFSQEVPLTDYHRGLIASVGKEDNPLIIYTKFIGYTDTVINVY